VSKLRLNGTSSGYVEIAAPATGANNTITLPSTTGSVVVQGASGITSFTSGPVLIGSGTSTGTASQTLQVTGGAYVSGDVGIGTTNPGFSLDVYGVKNSSSVVTRILNASTSSSQSILQLNSGQRYVNLAVDYQNQYFQIGQSSIETSYYDFNTQIFRSGVGTERARFTSGGYFKASNDGTYFGSGATIHEFRQTTTADNVYLTSTNASYASVSVVNNISRAANLAYAFFFGYSGGGGDLEVNLRGDGQSYCDGSWNGGGADYAEYFEWEDGNPDDEDRRGYSVSLIGDKIKIAEEGEQIIGVISGNPSVVGDAAWNKWSGKYLTDDFGSYIFEEHNVVEWTDEDGKQHSYEDWNLPEDVVVPEYAVIKTHDEKGNRFTHRKLNPEYDPDQEYIPREERPEWDAVGMMGKLRLRKGQLTGPNWIKLQDISATVEEWLVR